jgi:hypothetical protein
LTATASDQVVAASIRIAVSAVTSMLWRTKLANSSLIDSTPRASAERDSAMIAKRSPSRPAGAAETGREKAGSDAAASAIGGGGSATDEPSAADAPGGGTDIGAVISGAVGAASAEAAGGTAGSAAGLATRAASAGLEEGCVTGASTGAATRGLRLPLLSITPRSGEDFCCTARQSCKLAREPNATTFVRCTRGGPGLGAARSNFSCLPAMLRC